MSAPPSISKVCCPMVLSFVGLGLAVVNFLHQCIIWVSILLGTEVPKSYARDNSYAPKQKFIVYIARRRNFKCLFPKCVIRDKVVRCSRRYGNYWLILN